MDLKPEESQEQQILIVDDTPANIDVLDQFWKRRGTKFPWRPAGNPLSTWPPASPPI